MTASNRTLMAAMMLAVAAGPTFAPVHDRAPPRHYSGGGGSYYGRRGRQPQAGDKLARKALKGLIGVRKGW